MKDAHCVEFAGQDVAKVEEESRNADSVNDEQPHTHSQAGPQEAGGVSGHDADPQRAGYKSHQITEGGFQDILRAAALGKHGESDESDQQVHDLTHRACSRAQPQARQADDAGL